MSPPICADTWSSWIIGLVSSSARRSSAVVPSPRTSPNTSASANANARTRANTAGFKPPGTSNRRTLTRSPTVTPRLTPLRHLDRPGTRHAKRLGTPLPRQAKRLTGLERCSPVLDADRPRPSDTDCPYEPPYLGLSAVREARARPAAAIRPALGRATLPFRYCQICRRTLPRVCARFRMSLSPPHFSSFVSSSVLPASLADIALLRTPHLSVSPPFSMAPAQRRFQLPSLFLAVMTVPCFPHAHRICSNRLFLCRRLLLSLATARRVASL